MSKGYCPVCNKEMDMIWICDDCREIQNSKVIVTEMLISDTQFAKLKKMYSGDTLQKNKVRGILKHEGRMFINHGGTTDYCNCGEIVLSSLCDDPALDYNDCSRINGTGGFFHGNNQRIEYRGEVYQQIPYMQYHFKIGIRQTTLF